MSEKKKKTQQEIEAQIMRAAAAATFTGMQITLSTRDDDKDSDTRLEIWINLAGERQAAYLDIPKEAGLGFPDWTNIVLTVPPNGVPMKKADISGSWVQLRINPNGNDTWRFTCGVVLHFSDGSIYQKQFDDPTTLDQGSRQANKYL